MGNDQPFIMGPGLSISETAGIIDIEKNGKLGGKQIVVRLLRREFYSSDSNFKSGEDVKKRRRHHFLHLARLTHDDDDQ